MLGHLPCIELLHNSKTRPIVCILSSCLFSPRTKKMKFDDMLAKNNMRIPLADHCSFSLLAPLSCSTTKAASCNLHCEMLLRS
jgi:hypothetical protein